MRRIRSGIFRRYRMTILGLLGAFLFSAIISFAAPPSSPYTPGETLDPTCAPGDANCYVESSSGDSFYTDDGALTGNRAIDLDGNTLSFTGGTVLIGGTPTFSGFSTNGGLLYTNGSGVVSQTGAGTANQVLHGGINPTYSAVSLSADVSGDLPFANLAQITGLSVLGVTGTSTADVAAITGTANQVLRINAGGTALGFGTIANAGLANSSISFATGTSGTNVNWSSSPVSLGGTATLNIPDASASARGLVTTTGTQTFAGDKIFTSEVAVGTDLVDGRFQVSSAEGNYLRIDNDNGIYGIGDLSGLYNGSYFQIDDANHEIDLWVTGEVTENNFEIGDGYGGFSSYYQNGTVTASSEYYLEALGGITISYDYEDTNTTQVIDSGLRFDGNFIELKTEENYDNGAEVSYAGLMLNQAWAELGASYEFNNYDYDATIQTSNGGTELYSSREYNGETEAFSELSLRPDISEMITPRLGIVGTYAYNDTLPFQDAQVAILGGLGPEEITNGTFTGNANGWVTGGDDDTLPSDNWAYGTNNAQHTPGEDVVLRQDGELVYGETYKAQFTIGGTTGWVQVCLGENGDCAEFDAGDGSVTFTGSWEALTSSKILFYPSSDFDGTIDNVSVKRVFSNRHAALDVQGKTNLQNLAISGTALGDLYGAELITNGTFTANTDGWQTEDPGGGNPEALDSKGWAYDNRGWVEFDSGTQQSNYLTQVIDLTEGAQYRVSIKVQDGDGRVYVALGGDNDANYIELSGESGITTVTLTAGAGDFLWIVPDTDNNGDWFSGFIDEVSVKEVTGEAALSVTGNTVLHSLAGNGSGFVSVDNDGVLSWSAGGAGGVGGSNTQLQFNDDGNMAGATDVLYSKGASGSSGDSLGDEEITNGSVTGNTNGWTAINGDPLPANNWSYGSNNLNYDPNGGNPVAQLGELVEGATYRITFTVTGTAGTISVRLDGDIDAEYAYNAGTVTLDKIYGFDNGTKIVFSPSNDFDGNLDDISVKRVNLEEGAEQITNGTFTGNADDWESNGNPLPDGNWAYGSNNVEHTSGSIEPVYQFGNLVEGGRYIVRFDIGGTTGSVNACLGNGDCEQFAAGDGSVEFLGHWQDLFGISIYFEPTTDFDGTIDNVSVKPILYEEGSEELTNGTFTGNGDDWVTDTNDVLPSNDWAYSSNNVEHTAGTAVRFRQDGELTQDGHYIARFNIGGTTGTVEACLGENGDCFEVSAGDGDVTFIGTWRAILSSKILFDPSSDFDGTIDNVSVKSITYSASETTTTSQAKFGIGYTDIAEFTSAKVSVSGLGDEELTNGKFTGNATGWDLGSNWDYDDNTVVHDPVGETILSQDGSLTDDVTYHVSFTMTGTDGIVTVYLDESASYTFTGDTNGTTRTFSFTHTYDDSSALDTEIIVFFPDSDFDGTIDNVSIREVLNSDSINAIGNIAIKGELDVEHRVTQDADLYGVRSEVSLNDTDNGSLNYQYGGYFSATSLGEVGSYGVYAVSETDGEISVGVYGRGARGVHAVSTSDDAGAALYAESINGPVLYGETARVAATGEVFPALYVQNTGTFDTTAEELISYGAVLDTTTTRSAGANDLINIGLAISVSGGQENYALITTGGNVGIGNSTPNVLLHVGDDSVTDFTDLLTLEDEDSICSFNADSGSPTCGSDLTLKKDIESLNTVDILMKVSLLNPVSYRWKTDEEGKPVQFGFIAQEVEEQFPELVTEREWIDGSTKKFLNIGGLMPYAIGAIKELNLKVANIENISAPENSFAAILKAWFADAANAIEEFVATRIKARETFCINETCLTETELKALLENAGIAIPPPAVTESENNEAPEEEMPEPTPSETETETEDLVSPVENPPTEEPIEEELSDGPVEESGTPLEQPVEEYTEDTPTPPENSPEPEPGEQEESNSGETPAVPPATP